MGSSGLIGIVEERPGVLVCVVVDFFPFSVDEVEISSGTVIVPGMVVDIGEPDVVDVVVDVMVDVIVDVVVDVVVVVVVVDVVVDVVVVFVVVVAVDVVVDVVVDFIADVEKSEVEANCSFASKVVVLTVLTSFIFPFSVDEVIISSGKIVVTGMEVDN